MSKLAFRAAFAAGLFALVWVAAGFINGHWLALAMTGAIAITYGLGALELTRFSQTTGQLNQALAEASSTGPDLQAWLERVPATLRNPVRLRIDGERVGLPGPALTPYLVGLLVMLGMLGTFLGMVVTFKGVVFALEGSGDLQAIRSALAEPIKGLGLAFGTSIAGVATSAMLGLMSAMCRRQRLEASRLLDTHIATSLRPFSRAHQREQASLALQAQSQALPAVADKLQAMMDHMAQHHLRLSEQLATQQAQFHQQAASTYTDLARDVSQSLKDSLSASSKAAGDSLKPIVESSMGAMALEGKRSRDELAQTTQAQLQAIIEAFASTAQTVSQGWTQSLGAQTDRNASLLQGLEGALHGIRQAHEQGTQHLIEQVQGALSASQSTLAQADAQRLQAWSEGLNTLVQGLQGEWRHMGIQTLQQQRAISEAMERHAGEITQRVSEQAAQNMADLTRLLGQTEALVQARSVAEATWSDQQGKQLQALTQLCRAEIATMRDEEAARGQAAVARLSELQAAVATHLATLGAALEAPMSRLMQTAADVPQAAAEVIVQLRQEMSQLSERDNQASAERNALMAQLRELVQGLARDTGQQRAAIEGLSTAAMASLSQASQQHSETLAAQASKAVDVAAHVTGSAIELTSLGEAFQHGIERFSASNDKLMEGLQRIEDALQKSMARSDDQLAYYVAQAREVIDLSIASQQGIVEDMRKLHSKAAPRQEGAAG
jgi:hypothetical protein